MATVTCTENLVEFGPVVFCICERTNKQTEKQTNRHKVTLTIGSEV